jgi:hypothetical protein
MGIIHLSYLMSKHSCKDYNKHIVKIDKNKNICEITINGNYDEIFYCPWCGKRLNEKEN